MNLGWKLAATVNGTTLLWLLDTHERERRAVGEHVVRNSFAQEELASAITPDQTEVRELLAEIPAEHPDGNRSLPEQISGLAISYQGEEGSHPLAGQRAPARPELDGSSGPARLFELLPRWTFHAPVAAALTNAVRDHRRSRQPGDAAAGRARGLG
jgi:hypothetical protein